jgi:hypothetical protein
MVSYPCTRVKLRIKLVLRIGRTAILDSFFGVTTPERVRT